MNKMMRRHRRLLGIVLLVLQICGARVVAVAEPCGRSRVIFEPARSFKAIIKAVTRQGWKHSQGRPLCIRATCRSSHDCRTIQNGTRSASVVSSPQAGVRLGVMKPRGSPRYVWKLAADIHPVQPTHLYSKK